jgi:hypothetical protein
MAQGVRYNKHLHVAERKRKRVPVKRFVGVMTLASLVGLGSTPAAAQSLDAQGTASVLLIADARTEEVSPLFAKMIMPSSTDWSVREDVPATRGSALPLLYAGLIGLQAYDGFSTSRGLKQGAVESNAMMATLVKHPASLWGAKAGTAFASIYIAERLWKQHRRGAAIAMMVASNAMMVAVASNNAKVLRRLN